MFGGGDTEQLKNCIKNSIAVINDYNLTNTTVETYNSSQRNLYYTAVDAAEEYISKNFEGKQNDDVETICEAMRLIGVANTYRHESYTGVPTVTHVVQLMQAKKTSVGELLLKYQNTDNTPCSPSNNQSDKERVFCSVGIFGLIISTLEQIGYMRRFYDEYCDGNHKDDNTCSKKLKKYYTRYQDALIGIGNGNDDKKTFDLTKMNKPLNQVVSVINAANAFAKPNNTEPKTGGFKRTTKSNRKKNNKTKHLHKKQYGKPTKKSISKHKRTYKKRRVASNK